MMYSLKELAGDEVLARDGSIGSLEDVLLDEERLTVRYLGVATGEATPDGRLLIPPAVVETQLSSGHKLRLALTLEQAHGAPRTGPPRLRSGAELLGYDIQARDGSIGEVQDLVLDADTWAVRDVLVDTLKWWPGGLVRVHPAYVERIDRDTRTVHLRLTRDEVKLSGAATPRA
jgi:sporulation protein YlmC with PRC-barrel domain